MIGINTGRLEVKPVEEIKRNKGIEPGGRVQKFIDSEVLRRCSPYVPYDNGDLNRSGTKNTKIGSGVVKYNTVYARRWYYRPANFKGAPMRGNYWFEKMKQNGGKKAILTGAKRIAGRG